MKITVLFISLSWITVIFLLSQKLISIGRLLLIRAITVSIITAYISNSWFALIIFLIYITGVLVIFGYFIAISPNTQHTAKKCFKSYAFLFSIGLITNYFVLPNNLPSINIGFEKDVMFMLHIININIYWLITIILLLALLIVVSITYKSPSPLRNYLV